ncbi:helix-turn-helix domain-containing protein [Massilia sp. 2TAF26]
MSLPSDLTTTRQEHLTALVEARVGENTYLDFKRDLPSRDARGTQDLVADVSAFANSTGGDLIYGIDEDGEGQASRIVPQAGNMDEEVRRVQDVLMNNIEPRVPGLQVISIAVEAGFVLVIRVPQSWAGPHRVRTNNAFYLRENGRKRTLEVPEIRGLFLRSDQQAQRVRDFRTERLGQILSGGAPHRIVDGALLVGHFVPTQAALGGVNVDPVLYMRQRSLPVLGNTIPGARVNVDGALVVRNPRSDGTFGYSQFFRNGFFETVKVLSGFGANPATLGSVAYERELISLVRQFREECTHLGIGTEMTCMLSLLRATNLELGINRWDYNLDDHQGRFDRDTLILADVLLPAELDADKALRPVFDYVWQAAGMERSFNYSEAGDWAPR